MAKYGMVVDLQSCSGCSSCITACKREHSVPADKYWCDSEIKYEGKFPMVKLEYLSTRCNHCDDAPCAEVCPTGAMFKADNGLVKYERDDCISCRQCVNACPYEEVSFNEEDPHSFWDDNTAVIDGFTGTPQETADQVGANPAYAGEGTPVREEGLVEKCTFCAHRVPDKDPICVNICPCDALVFGDLDDPNSEVSQLLDRYDAKVRIQKGETGDRRNADTGPNVYYIREYCNLDKATAK
ncbi:4Fe-4S dicluster domain-containing protein [Fuchsiella alkaliacetigena]|uniref:4Fe-4S dicluster domain-containing protein n=1 Tax=Fuchsiella alkaliacetigena TaxID=957042 RepID=UPI00200B5F42|nr:4Fe-4S dicluster domain-containing protein [Fuchsiella alkaliacetigena]MCK8825010.1 4Fe-4S dicluster domain-containing protein [Fuchsiella alkaliacetigena]